MRKQRLWSLLALLLATAVLPGLAQAADITVDGTTCTLAEAITAANNDNADSNGCVDGSGNDTITLQVDVTLAAALPQITSNITIEGGGHFISGNNDTAVGSVLTVGSGADLTLNETTVKEGNKDGNGGGIYNQGTVTLTNSTVSGNMAFSSSIWPFGGGIYNEGTLNITNSTVSDNTVFITANYYSAGGGIYNKGTAWLINSTVSGNTASVSDSNAYGGGIYNLIGSVTLINSTVSSNTASTSSPSFSSFGGGMRNLGGTITLHSSIISGNIAAEGKEVYNDSATVNVDSFNVFGHSDETSAEAFVDFTPGATTDVTATSDSGTATALEVILNPTLADNGGPTLTHALRMNSPAIDLDAACNTNLSTDQRGYDRPIGVSCDAGAFEYDPTNTDSDDDGLFDAQDNCPLVANPNQEDMDEDGLGNACDADIDGDGLDNDQDNCPLVANPGQEDSDHNGIGNACEPKKSKVPIYKLLLLKDGE